MTKTPTTHYPPPILNEHQPSKPRRYMNHTDRLPTPHRPDSDYMAELPRIFMGWRVWPDGRREPAERGNVESAIVRWMKRNKITGMKTVKRLRCDDGKARIWIVKADHAAD